MQTVAPTQPPGLDPLALYAAVVATVAIGWQIFTWLRGRRTEVRVSGRFATVPFTTGPTNGVQVQAVNLSDHPVEIRNAWVRGNRATAADEVAPDPAMTEREVQAWGELPKTLAPHAAYVWTLAQYRLERGGIDLSQGAEGWIYLATGQNFHTRRFLIRSRKTLRAQPGGGGEGPPASAA